MKNEAEKTDNNVKISSKPDRPEPVLGKDGMPLEENIRSCGQFQGEHNSQEVTIKNKDKRRSYPHQRKEG